MRIAARASFVVSALLGMTLVASRADAQGIVSASLQAGDFRVAVSNYYHVPEREVVVIHDRKVRDEDIPVVLFIAQRARVAPATIVELRLKGMSWWSISTRFHIGADVYYVPVAVTPGPPYGKAYGHYKKKSRNQWNTIVLADDDVVNMVHLRFLSDYYHVAPERVIEARGRNGNFVAVQQEMSSKKDKHGDDDGGKKGSDKKSDKGSNGRGRGRGGE